jgi:peptidoglycan-associated lipoprotein
MKQMFSNFTLLAALGLSLAACGGKKKVALEAPPSTSAPTAISNAPSYGEQTPGVGNGIIPGSQDDLRAQAGTDTILFALDSDSLDGEARATLARHAEWLKRNPGVRVTVEGHCDERGTREYNLALGDRRANAAKNFLASQGVAVSLMTIISYGKERQAVDGTGEAAWAQNRRAVTVIASR